MTNPPAEAMEAPAPAKPAPLWEDFIDIFHSPSEVYERRRNANPWPMIIIITVLVTLIGVLTWNSLAPVYEAEMRAVAQKQMAANPQMTADAMETGIKFQMVARRWGGVFFALGVLVIALPIWLLGRIVGAKEMTYTRALVVVTWSSIITVLAMLAIGVQGLVMDVSALTTPDKLSLSAARFVDKDSMNAFAYTALKMLDVFGIWSLVVMAIGVRVTGRGTKNSAIMFGAIWFVVALLIAGAFAMRAAAAG
jgi:hypothetical protein